MRWEYYSLKASDMTVVPKEKRKQLGKVDYGTVEKSDTCV